MAERRRGLGKGIGALIPNSQKEVKDRPIDVFFGGNSEEKKSKVSLEEKFSLERGNKTDRTTNSATKSTNNTKNNRKSTDKTKKSREKPSSKTKQKSNVKHDENKQNKIVVPQYESKANSPEQKSTKRNGNGKAFDQDGVVVLSEESFRIAVKRSKPDRAAHEDTEAGRQLEVELLEEEQEGKNAVTLAENSESSMNVESSISLEPSDSMPVKINETHLPEDNRESREKSLTDIDSFEKSEDTMNDRFDNHEEYPEADRIADSETSHAGNGLDSDPDSDASDSLDDFDSEQTASAATTIDRSNAGNQPDVVSTDDALENDSDGGLVEVPGATFAELPLTAIIPNTKQPRTVFDEDELAELAASIKEVGVLQPVIVRPLEAPIADKPEARYELIMGERRWRACELAGIDTVPAIVRHTQDQDLLRDALLENLHRTQLNALEEAAAYQQLLEDFQCTQEELSRRIARSRPQISNTLRLLKLPPLVQRRVAAGGLSAGHARALLGLSDSAAMERIAHRIVAEGLSVRQVEELVAVGDEQTPPRPVRRRTKRYAPELGELSTRLADRFDTRVKVEMGAKRGSIKIDFASIDELNRILGVLTPGEGGIDIPE